ncbi:helix-turn-helix protein [Streptomyces brevispora]|uniref:Helix-turn-helix protein n=1 Tax=Streptomyces brevispora TaxID=887462 RepID=A0A561TU48_9ACTN|nr:helix-turn-helix protein [Streptomyces brevispora]
MDTAHELRESVAGRRAKITPQQAGLPAFGGGIRRVPGLRREEVALLAGFGIDYYARLERGQLAGASEEVLDAVCRALSKPGRLDLARLSLPRTACPRRRLKNRAKVPPGRARDVCRSNGLGKLHLPDTPSSKPGSTGLMPVDSFSGNEEVPRGPRQEGRREGRVVGEPQLGGAGMGTPAVLAPT